MMLRPNTFSLCLVTVAFACAPGSDDEAGAGDVEIPITEEIRIGRLDGPEEYVFGRMGAIAPGPDRSVYVAEAQLGEIRHYDSDGRYIGAFGRKGEGPGEFESVDGLAVLEDGRVVVWDAGLRRLSVFSDMGDHVSSVPVSTGFGGWRGFVWSPEGDLLIRVPPEEGIVETPDGLQTSWARITLDGDVTVLWAPPPEDRAGPRYVIAGRGGFYYPFVTATLSTTGPDGSRYTVRNDSYAIEHTTPDGIVTSINRAAERIDLTAEERAEWEARSESFAQRLPDRRSDFFPIPGTKPYIRELLVDIDGRLWVSRYTEPEFVPYTDAQAEDRRRRNLPSFQWRDRLRWDVFSPTDRYIGSVTLPPNTSLIVATGADIWAIQSGELDEDYVVRYRMELH